MRILITGGCGFVGSNLAVCFKQKYPFYQVVVLDNLKRRGSELNIERLKRSGVTFIHGDIRNKEDIENVGHIDFLIDAAAEPSILAGLNESTDYVINTNLNGTVNCLNYALKFNAGFIFLSTSRVYPFYKLDEVAFEETEERFIISNSQTIKGISANGITTDFPLVGARSLYGATKLSSELIIQEYMEFLNVKAVINRCGVITGPWQMGKVDQGVVVLWLLKHYWNSHLTYNGYGGKGKQVRDILHVHDLFQLIDIQISDIEKYQGNTYNVGGGLDCSCSLLELTNICESITGNKILITPIEENRKADIRLYITDNSKVSNETGWKPKYKPKEIMNEIFAWVIQYETQLKSILN